MITFRTLALRAAATAVVIGAVSLGTAGLAGAEQPLSENDKAFLDSLSDVGIDFGNPAGTIALAGSVCDAIDEGTTYGELFDAAMEESSFSADQADALIFDSVFYYCVDLLPYVA